jgi:hypothetical protein
MWPNPFLWNPNRNIEDNDIYVKQSPQNYNYNVPTKVRSDRVRQSEYLEGLSAQGIKPEVASRMWDMQSQRMNAKEDLDMQGFLNNIKIMEVEKQLENEEHVRDLELLYGPMGEWNTKNPTTTILNEPLGQDEETSIQDPNLQPFGLTPPYMEYMKGHKMKSINPMDNRTKRYDLTVDPRISTLPSIFIFF